MKCKLTDQEHDDLSNQILLVGQLLGLSMRLNGSLLEKWLDRGEVPPDFRYEKQVRAAIQFGKDSLGR
jgi:hypothetical protein